MVEVFLLDDLPQQNGFQHIEPLASDYPASQADRGTLSGLYFGASVPPPASMELASQEQVPEADAGDDFDG